MRGGRGAWESESAVALILRFETLLSFLKLLTDFKFTANPSYI